ncbi:MAG: hypothetical protein M1838_002619 [Thelocarpon superellum]|nr:MAG: hypothetical protein M1838_002619 [Thelocarpon superellum]
MHVELSNGTGEPRAPTGPPIRNDTIDAPEGPARPILEHEHEHEDEDEDENKSDYGGVVPMYGHVAAVSRRHDDASIVRVVMYILDLASTYRLELGAAGIVLTIAYIAANAVYQLYFSPIAGFPGPWLAAVTFWYEFYYDVVLRGRYTWRIGELHQQYGPIVRINPYELHINDPDFYDDVYAGPTKTTDKWAWSAKMFGDGGSGFSTVSHDLHRRRRAALSTFFSKRSVTRLEPMIQGAVDHLCARLRGFQPSGEPLNLGHAWSALTADVITEYSFGKSFDLLSTPDFASDFYDMMMAPSELTHLIKQFGWLFPLLERMPHWFVAITNPPIMALIRIQLNMEDQVRRIQASKPEEYSTGEHPTIFHELLTADIPREEQTMRRMVYEGQTLVGAGTLTTAHALKTISYHLLANPASRRKLQQELAAAGATASAHLPLQQLEQLPYLHAVVNEGLRLGYGVSSRLQRVAPDRALQFEEWVIPPGTPVSMTSVYLHDNERLFPDPRTWKPERWLEGASMDRLEKYLVPFSRGTRGCLGMNLAYAEMYLATASVFGQFDLVLYETTRDDVETAHDFFNPSPRLDSTGLRVTVGKA